jgi:positive regulator of sigma E activity
MRESAYIETTGLVTSCHHDRVTIILSWATGCASCHNSLCMLGESQSKYVEVTAAGNSFFPGDKVVVRVKPASAYGAMLWLYGIPFLLVMVTLMGMLGLSYSESIAGVASLLVLVPYFLIFYSVRKRSGKTCQLEVVKK